MKLPFVSQGQYDALVAAHQEQCERIDKLVHRVAKLESLLVKAVEKVQHSATSTDLRRPPNTWRSRAITFTKQSHSDPSTFPGEDTQEEINVQKK